MAKETEIKYLIKEDDQIYATPAFLDLFPDIHSIEKIVSKDGKNIKQGYLSVEEGYKLAKSLNLDLSINAKEARLRKKADDYFFTLKGKSETLKSGGVSRDEFEIKISKDKFEEYWPETKGKRLEKTRLDLPIKNGLVIEIDVYKGLDLIVAEIEFPPTLPPKKVPELGLYISGNKKYSNVNLAR